MSGTASRYIGGVPYAPGMGVGRYPSASSIIGSPGPRQAGAYTPSAQMVDASGIALNPTAGRVSAQSGGMNNSNLLLAAALGLLGYAPDAYSAVRDLVGGDTRPVAQAPETAPAQGAGLGANGAFVSGQLPTGAQFPSGARFISGGAGEVLTLPDGAIQGPDGFVELPNGTFYDATSYLDQPFSGPALPAAPVETLSGDGFGSLGAQPSEFASVSAPAGAPSVGGGLPVNMANDPFYGSLGETPLVGGDLATGLAGLGGGAAGGWISSQAFQNSRRPYAQMGQQAGSALGGIAAGALLGSAFGPIGTAFGALGGAFGGGMLGGAAGSAIGPQPTIGRNFSAIGSFGGDGNIAWGGAGGDNGGDASGALGFANQFGQNLLQRAAAQGFSFNPNMAGAQFRVGGYDNFSRRGQTPGGFFYTPDTTGGSPENYALRPGGGSEAYSPGQQDALTNSVLADLAARGVFVPQGTQSTLGLDYYANSQGAPLGWYDQSWVGGGAVNDPFSAILAQRQGDVGGWFAGGAERQAQAERTAQLAQMMTPDGLEWLPGYGPGGAPAEAPAYGIVDTYQGA